MAESAFLFLRKALSKMRSFPNQRTSRIPPPDPKTSKRGCPFFGFLQKPKRYPEFCPLLSILKSFQRDYHALLQNVLKIILLTGNLSKLRRQRERRQTKGLKSRTTRAL